MLFYNIVFLITQNFLQCHEYSRKRVLEIVEEKNTFETGKFLEQLESKFGFPIHTIQVDNGYEFVNDKEVTNRKPTLKK